MGVDFFSLQSCVILLLTFRIRVPLVEGLTQKLVVVSQISLILKNKFWFYYCVIQIYRYHLVSDWIFDILLMINLSFTTLIAGDF